MKKFICLTLAIAALAAGAATKKTIEQRFITRSATLCKSIGGHEITSNHDGAMWVRCEATPAN